MSLREISRRDIDNGSLTFIDRFQANSPSSAAGGLDGDDSFRKIGNNQGRRFYLDKTDQFYAAMEGSNFHWARMDPLLAALDYGPGTLNEMYDGVTAGGPFQENYFVGEFDADADEQRVYGTTAFTGGSDGSQLEEVDLASPFITRVPDFAATNFRAGGISLYRSAGSLTVQGARPATSAGALVFESAEPATWPSGYALMAGAVLRDDAGAGLMDYQRVLCQVDLADEGGATGPPGGFGRALIVPTPNYYASSISPLHPTAHAGPIGGFNVWFDHLQFAPDGDSTVTAPKGRIFMVNRPNDNNHRIPPGPTGAGSVYHRFVKIIEWNPTGKDATPGNINRVNLRTLLVSLCKFIENETLANGGIGIGSEANMNDSIPFFHPPTETMRYWVNTEPVAGVADGDSTAIEFSLTPEVDEITVPTAVGQAETAKTMQFRSTALGDLGERISGVDLDWTLDRRSTDGEVLTNPGPGGSVAVANFPIDGESATDSSLVVFEDGVPLTVTTHFTVVLATGVITGVGAVFDVTKVYTVDYQHSTNGAQPPFGILRTTQSRTDANGVALATVEVPDDDEIALEFDGVSSVESP